MGKARKIDVAILGLLAHDDLTGYDMKKRIDGALRFFWKGSFGSIYPALSDMEKQGLVERLPGDGAGGRERIVYHITGQGREVLRAWLEDGQASNELKYETLLKLFFGGAASPEVSIRTLEEYEKTVTENLAMLRLCRENLERALDEEDHLYFYLTVTYGIETYEASLNWCAQAKKMLAGRMS